jgi:hypothetical protein
MTISNGQNGLQTALDLDAIDAKNREEREKRINKRGLTQFREAKGELAKFATDPWAASSGERPPVNEDVDVLIVGCGFGGILAAKKLHDAGVTSIRMVDKASDFGGVWYWNRLAPTSTGFQPNSELRLPLDTQVYTATQKPTFICPCWKRQAMYPAPNMYPAQRSMRMPSESLKWRICAQKLYSKPRCRPLPGQKRLPGGRVERLATT